MRLFRFVNKGIYLNLNMITIDPEKCTGCGGCIDLCPSIAISMIQDVVTIDQEICTECKICVKVCPMRAPYEVE